MLLALSLSFSSSAAGLTYTDLQKRSKELQEKKLKTQEKLSEIKSQSRDVFQELNSLQRQIDKLEQQASSLVQRRDLLENHIDQLNNQISELGIKIESEKSAIDETVYKLYKWQKVAPSALVLVVSSSVNPEVATYALGKVLKEHNEKMTSYQQNVQELEAKKKELQSAHAQVADTIKELQAQLDELQSKYAQREKLYAQLKADQAKYAKQIAQIEEEQRKVSAEIERMLAATKLASNASGGGFAKPMTGIVTSPFGWRINPLTGRGRDFHTGIDVANQYGTPIRASKGGVVIYAGWKTGYGLVAIVDHQDGYGTVYAHMSRIAVSTGTKVSPGQIVGYEGSTGWATGPHLHFEIRIEGKPVDPAKYVRF
ncbi:peptidoglycan DD-metalloendopeptidase family protein [Coprothermobacteraceae bacterium]|nr:peptidoglycan DD-metalloendopeptidase family protein [Coprothermobacteraceae bacterium]